MPQACRLARAVAQPEAGAVVPAESQEREAPERAAKAACLPAVETAMQAGAIARAGSPGRPPEAAVVPRVAEPRVHRAAAAQRAARAETLRARAVPEEGVVSPVWAARALVAKPGLAGRP